MHSFTVQLTIKVPLIFGGREIQMSKTVVRKMNHLKMRYVDLNVQFLKVEQSKKYVNVNFTKNQA